jgi:hypothetical protein
LYGQGFAMFLCDVGAKAEKNGLGFSHKVQKIRMLSVDTTSDRLSPTQYEGVIFFRFVTKFGLGKLKDPVLETMTMTATCPFETRSFSPAERISELHLYGNFKIHKP